MNTDKNRIPSPFAPVYRGIKRAAGSPEIVLQREDEEGAAALPGVVQRVTVVGETLVGGAVPNRPTDLPDNFVVTSTPRLDRPAQVPPS